ncbi:flagellar motor protein MotA [endosymbiont of Acanthamoeba sp. UWC8]|uniref:flagellar motor stator protein MotA n=1 Tax=endosymbiont of Acanthamoeba sp. UWC8 TaxID=86106 RepID=UPI0004D1280C|nr:flagellar motor stator protein MotA [endosymbiont of Acanthamoeba sp. UWC8]AIF81750.1 flagellar motor protein MotA [endosymbiont of Acanthamoeba sp. UWC8]
MLLIVGIIIILGAVFGGYALHGGSIGVILEALPFEMLVIGGAAVGATIVGNKTSTLKKCLSDVVKCFKGTKWSKKDYQDLLCLLFLITKTIKTKGILVIEEHIEKPSESSIFSQFPKILADKFVISFICDTLRIVTMSLEDPYQIEDNMQRQLDKYAHEVTAGSDALQTMSDALPAIGIVAAVLGVIKTMASIDQPPSVLGMMIGSALVGTFLGVFLAYCIVGPMSNKAKAIHMQDLQFLFIIRDTIIAHLKGNAPQISVEIGRGNVPGVYQPTFFELEEAMKDLKVENKEAAPQSD